MLKFCARIGDTAEEIVREILSQKSCNLESVGCSNVPSSKRKTALHIACENGSFAIAKLLLENGAKVNCEDCDVRYSMTLNTP